MHLAGVCSCRIAKGRNERHWLAVKDVKPRDAAIFCKILKKLEIEGFNRENDIMLEFRISAQLN
jgi:hypothetical protein